MNQKKQVKKVTIPVKSVPKVPEKPKPPEIKEVKLDYYVAFQDGELYAGKTIQRAVVVKHRVWLEGVESKESKDIVSVIDGVKVVNGFGSNPKETVDDFIKRNSVELLNKIFDIKLGA